jgi:hypothetical protein
MLTPDSSLHHGQKLNEEFDRYFGNRYQRMGKGFSQIGEVIVAAKCRLFILFVLCFILAIMALKYIKPRSILKYGYMQGPQICTKSLVTYGLVYAAGLTVIVGVAMYNLKQYKRLLFVDDCGELCSDSPS